MSQSTTILERARQGDAGAIAALMNRSLQPKGITARVVREDNDLQVHLESEQGPSQPSLVEFTRKGITGLDIPDVYRVYVYGMQVGRPVPIWEETLYLRTPVPDFLDSSLTNGAEEPQNNGIEEPQDDGDDAPAVETMEGEFPIVEPEPASKGSPVVWMAKNWVLLAVLAGLLVVGFGLGVLLWNRFFTPQPTASSTPTIDAASLPNDTASPAAPTSPAAESPAPTSPASPAPTGSSAQALTYQAYSLGMSAAVKTQTAATEADWNRVIQDWEAAIQRLEAVPADAPDRATVQKKIEEYRRNLKYAQERLAAVR